MSEPPLTAALFIKNLAVILASAIGSLVSLCFIKRDDGKKGVRLLLDNLMLILGGFGFSMFVAPAAHEYLSLTAKALPAVHFLFGLFGLSVAYQVNERVSTTKWFCSEAIADCLGYRDAWRFDPNTLFVVLRRANDFNNKKVGE